MQKIIGINDITVCRGQIEVFDRLSLEVALGCNTAILGPNGAGKSTLLKLLSCELYPVARDGSYVELFGHRRWNVWDLRSRLGIVSGDLQNEYSATAPGLNVILSGLYASVDVWSYQHFSSRDKE